MRRLHKKIIKKKQKKKKKKQERKKRTPKQSKIAKEQIVKDESKPIKYRIKPHEKE